MSKIFYEKTLKSGAKEFFNFITLFLSISSMAYASHNSELRSELKNQATLRQLNSRIHDDTNIEGPICYFNKPKISMKDLQIFREKSDYKNSRSVFINAGEAFDFNTNFNFGDKNLIIYSPSWVAREKVKIKTTSDLYGFGDEEKRSENDTLKLTATKIILNNLGYGGKLLTLKSSDVSFNASSSICHLYIKGGIKVSKGVKILTNDFRIKGNLKNLGEIKSFNTLNLSKGKSVVNGASNEEMGLIAAGSLSLILDKEGLLDNRFGKIFAQSKLECHANKVICGDKDAKMATVQEKNAGTLLGWAYSGTQYGKAEKYGEYYINNGSFINSYGPLSLDTHTSLELNYGDIFSHGKMTLIAQENISLKAGTIQSSQDIDLKAKALSLTREAPERTQVGWTSECYTNDHTDRRTSGPSKIKSLRSIHFDVSQVSVCGSSIYANGNFLDSSYKIIKKNDDDKEIYNKNFFKGTSYNGRYWGTYKNGGWYGHACPYFFQDPCEIKAGQNIVLENMGFIELNNVTVNAQNVGIQGDCLTARTDTDHRQTSHQEASVTNLAQGTQIPAVKIEPVRVNQKRVHRHNSEAQKQNPHINGKRTNVFVKDGYRYTKEKIVDLSDEEEPDPRKHIKREKDGEYDDSSVSSH